MQGPEEGERPTTSSLRRRVTAVGGAGARIAQLGSETLDPGLYPTAGPCSNASLQRNLGLCRGLQYKRCTALCSGLNNEDERQSAPLTGALYCTPTRRASTGYTGRNEETPTAENEGEVRMRRACACTISPRSLFLLGRVFQPTPSPLCGLASWRLLGACSMYPGE